MKNNTKENNPCIGCNGGLRCYNPKSPCCGYFCGEYPGTGPQKSEEESEEQ